MILILIPVKSSFHDIIDSSKCWPLLVIFSDVLRYQTKMENPGSNGIWWHHQVLAGSLFFRWTISDISRLCIYIYIYTYIYIYNYIYTLVLSLYLAIRSSNSIHWSSISTSSLIGGWFAILGTSRVANEIYHWLGGGIIWLTSLSHEKSWNFGPLVACWGFVGDGICNTQLCGGYNNHYN